MFQQITPALNNTKTNMTKKTLTTQLTPFFKWLKTKLISYKKLIVSPLKMAGDTAENA